MMMTWMTRILGIINLLFVALGAYYSVVMIHAHWNKWPGNPTSFDWLVFLCLYAVSLLMLLYLGYLGVRLIKKDESALWKLSLLFVTEMVYFYVFVTVTWVVMPMSTSKIAVGLWGRSQDPLAPQIITGYPLIGLIVTLIILLMRRISRKAHVN
jgi:membrane protease YdiL (CAAX protease family)